MSETTVEDEPQANMGDLDESVTRFQVELKQHIDSQATKLLSIWLAFIGIFISVGLAFGSGQLSFLSNPSIASVDIYEIAITTSYLNYDWMEMMIFASMLYTALAILSTIYHLFIVSPWKALDVLQQDSPRPLGAHGVQRVNSIPSDSQLLKRNARIIDDIEENWQQCLASVKNGLISLALAIPPMALVFVYFHPAFLVSIFISFVLSILYLMDRNFELMRDKLGVGNMLDYIFALSVAGTFFVISGNHYFHVSNSLLLFFYLITCVPFTYVSLRVGKRKVYLFTIKSASLAILSIMSIIVVIEVTSSGTEYTLARVISEQFFVSVFLATLIFTSLSLIISVKYVAEGILSKVRESQVPDKLMNRMTRE